MNDIFWIWLSLVLKKSSRAFAEVLEKFTPQGAYLADTNELITAGINEKYAERLADKNIDQAERILKRCAECGIKICHVYSPEYPKSLHQLKDKPYVLYVRGDLGCIKNKKTAALIGTRSMTDEGEKLSRRCAKSFIDKGCIIVSGAAQGVDSIGALVSLDMGVPTVAVLGEDIDKSSDPMLDSIAEKGGAVISEYPPFENARFFPSRNRIITALSSIMAVTEAPEGSGALIGSELALKMGIPVYAPDLEGDSFAGCRQLISMGAKKLSIEALPEVTVPEKRAEVKAPAPKRTAAKRTATKKAAPPVEEPKPKITCEADIPDDIYPAAKHILRVLLNGPAGDREFLASGEFPISKILASLTLLELRGYIKVQLNSTYKLI